MTIKTEIKVDKEKKVLTLLVTVPRKKYARDEDVSFLGKDAWEAVKNYKVPGYKVVEKRQGLIVDNWRLNNVEGSYEYELKEVSQAPKVKKAPQPVSSEEKTEKPKRQSRSTSTKKK
tara:strand:- start:67 stop:417 length:351 start_codon:yes stop_codon:yes gene_type:complete